MIENLYEYLVGILENEDDILEIVRRSEKTSPIHKLAFKKLKISEKNEEEIMEILDKVEYYGLFCVLASAYIKSEENLMHFLKMINWEYNSCKHFIEGEKIKKKHNLLKIIERTGWDSSICAEGIKWLENRGDILHVMKETKWDSAVFYRGIKAFDPKNEEDFMFLAKESKYNLNVCEHIIEDIKTTKNLFIIMNKTEYSPYINAQIIKKLEDEPTIMDIITNTSLNKEVCLEGVKKLQEKENILFLMKESKWDAEVCFEGFKKLGLEEKEDAEIMRSVEEHRSCSVFQEEIIPYLTHPINILFVTRNTGWSYRACALAVPILKAKLRTENKMMELAEELGYIRNFCFNTIRTLKNNKNIKILMEKTGWDSSICIEGIKKLKNKEEILYVMEKTGWNYHVCSTGLRILDFDNMTGEEVFRILKSSDFNPYLEIAMRR